MTGVAGGNVTFRLEHGRKLELRAGDPQLRRVDRAWASTVHAFQGRTVDRVIAATEANHPHLTTQKSFYVEISRAHDRTELVTDDVAEIRAQLQAVSGERIAALEGIGEIAGDGAGKYAEAAPPAGPQPGRGAEHGSRREGMRPSSKVREAPVQARGRDRGWTADCRGKGQAKRCATVTAAQRNADFSR